jgi:hypothetical protein
VVEFYIEIVVITLTGEESEMRTIQTYNFGRDVAGVRAIRIKFNREYGEYSVELVRIDSSGRKFVNEDETYHTDDRADARDTAQLMFDSLMEKHGAM